MRDFAHVMVVYIERLRQTAMSRPARTRLSAPLWHLANGRFQRQGVYGPEDRFASAVLGSEVLARGVFA